MWWGHLCLGSKDQMGTSLMGKDKKCHGLGWTHMAGIKWEMVRVSWGEGGWSSEHVCSYHSGESPEGCFTQGSWVQSEAVFLVALLCQAREGIDCIDCFICLTVGFTFSLLLYFPPSHTHTSLGRPPKRQAVSRQQTDLNLCTADGEAEGVAQSDEADVQSVRGRDPQQSPPPRWAAQR